MTTTDDERAHLKFSSTIAGLALLLYQWSLRAMELQVSDAWVAATVAGQRSAAAYMTLKSDEDAELVEIATDAAGRSSIHEMRSSDGMMHMRPMERLVLPAHRSVILAEGGYHVMLERLKAPLVAGRKIRVRFRLLDSHRAAHTIDVSIPIRARDSDEVR